MSVTITYYDIEDGCLLPEICAVPDLAIRATIIGKLISEKKSSMRRFDHTSRSYDHTEI